MDITGLDRATGRLVIQIRLDEITEALEGVQLDDNGTASYRAIRHTLQDQLSIIYGQDTDNESDNGDEARRTPSRSSSDTSANNSDDEGVVAEEASPTPELIEVPESEPELEPEATADCGACGDTKPEKDTIKLECSHVYCKDCIVDLFRFAVHKDTSLFPPRCCKATIPLDTNENGVKGCSVLLPAELLTEVNEKKAEQEKAQETPCSGADCDHVIPKENISGGVATCNICDTETCTVCEHEAHKGLCAEDDDTKILMATAGKVMWQQCTKCKNLVELDTGCFHIM
ncbi:hypothetical protein J4E83_003345 [Alternaria metachromatica]|uniref:uncharacterized protein n=1 Tax=Alternaria metachromatica TaxID=283354 RepID=UPI0020C4CBAD|nr:uncharacterized protein J4E83_003345 [Alternaria metachromatica]KAI4628792.1 hypothetical protein J4E83_003345 [Alternaria metachromatica]